MATSMLNNQRVSFAKNESGLDISDHLPGNATSPECYHLASKKVHGLRGLTRAYQLHPLHPLSPCGIRNTRPWPNQENNEENYKKTMGFGV